MNRMQQIGLASLTMAMVAMTAACGGGASAGLKSAPADSSGNVAQSGNFGSGRGAAPETTSAGSDSAAQEAPPPAPMSEPGGMPSARMDSAPAAKSSAPRAEGGARGTVTNDGEAVRPREPTNRPGLGTEWGETRRSSITTVPFVRADFTNPIATSAMFYNDEEGARAMASASGFRRTAGAMTTSGSGLVSIGLRDERGSFLSGFVAGDGRNYVVGEAGRRYTIVVRNRTQNRLELVVSVDGLDVLDGKAASFSKRGYLVDPQGEVEIDGFRQSMDTVAAFRFGSVRGSYASQKHGDTRNVGVIGVAVFHERGTNPQPWTPDEVQRRQQANPFPGQFATPPN